jgi:hypothetical protein
MSVTHKVLDHHLHHEWKSLGKYFPLAASAPDSVCVYKCIDNNNLFKVFEHNFFCLQKSTSWVFITFLESFFLSISGYWRSILLRQLPFTSEISSTHLDYWELDWYKIKGKRITLTSDSPKIGRTCCFCHRICGIWYTPKNTMIMKNQSRFFPCTIVFFQVWKNVRRLEIRYRATALLNHLYLQLWGWEITLCPATGYHIILQMMS